MRYKVKVDTDQAFVELLDVLRSDGVQAKAQSSRRRFVAVENPSGSLQQKFKALGAKVTQDVQFGVDAAAQSSD